MMIILLQYSQWLIVSNIEEYSLTTLYTVRTKPIKELERIIKCTSLARRLSNQSESNRKFQPMSGAGDFKTVSRRIMWLITRYYSDYPLPAGSRWVIPFNPLSLRWKTEDGRMIWNQYNRISINEEVIFVMEVRVRL